MAAARQLIENYAERPHVRLHARLPGHKLLRRHIADRSAARRIRRGNRRIPRQYRLRGVKARVLRPQPPRQAEVQNLHQAAIGEHHVLRLQVAMKDAERVRCLQSVGDLDADGKQQLQTRRPTDDELVKRLARHVLHGDVAFVAAFAHFVDAADVGMLNRRRQARFAQHCGPHLFHRERSGAKNLEYHWALKLRVVGQIHHATSSGAQAASYLIMFYRLARHSCPKSNGSSIRNV